jgi:hypothetical protein
LHLIDIGFRSFWVSKLLILCRPGRIYALGDSFFQGLSQIQTTIRSPLILSTNSRGLTQKPILFA